MRTRGILLVGNMGAERDNLRTWFECSYQMLEAQSQEQILQELETGHNRIAAILLGMEDPQLNGFEAVSYTHLDVYKRQYIVGTGLLPHLKSF